MCIAKTQVVSKVCEYIFNLTLEMGLGEQALVHGVIPRDEILSYYPGHDIMSRDVECTGMLYVLGHGIYWDIECTGTLRPVPAYGLGQYILSQILVRDTTSHTNYRARI